MNRVIRMAEEKKKSTTKKTTKKETVKINDIIVSESYNHSISKQFTTYEIPGILSLKINNDPSIK